MKYFSIKRFMGQKLSNVSEGAKLYIAVDKDGFLDGMPGHSTFCHGYCWHAFRAAISRYSSGDTASS
jgi:hypothetical protein